MAERFSGAVLTGGESRRMGRDKALLEVGGVPMALRVAGALREAGAVEVVAVGGDLEVLGRLGLAGVADPTQGEGPVGGIVVALERAPAPVVVVAACDLPYLGAEVVRALVAALPGHDVAMARTDRLEPLCAAWRAGAAEHLRRAFTAGERAVHRAAAGLDVVEVAVDRGSVANVNEPSDLPR